MPKTENIIILQRSWQAVAGAITLLLLVQNAPLNAMGWYYVLLCLAATYIVFDHGLSGLLTISSASKLVDVDVTQLHLLSEEKIKEFHSFCFDAAKKYITISVMFISLMGPVGFYYLSLSNDAFSYWPIVWSVLITATATNLLLMPLASILEGCGAIDEVYKIRMLQGFLGSVACWLAIISGHTLWAAVAIALATTVTQSVWLTIKWGHLIPFFVRRPDHYTGTDHTFNRMERRVGLTSLSSYILSQAIIIAVFQTEGPELAGRMGVSLTIVNMIALLSFSTVTSIVPRLSKAITQQKWYEADRLFNRANRIALLLFTALAILFLAITTTKYSSFLHPKLLSYQNLFLLFGITLCAQYITAMTLKLRCYLSDPLFRVSILTSGLMLLNILLSVSYFGINTLITSLIIVQACIALPLSIKHSRKYELESRWTASAIQTATQPRRNEAPAIRHSKLVVILMTTYNGESYLESQLHSIANQSHNNWELHISDDGSTDSTLKIIREFQKRTSQKVILYLADSNRGFMHNFFCLITKEIRADYFALADQDDVWCAEKLSVAINHLNTKDSSKPNLYCGRTQLIDSHGRYRGKSKLFVKEPSFYNALVQNIAGGNTMMMNASAINLIRETLSCADNAVSHDWWIYIAVTACGGEVYYDPAPLTLYRQHNHNVIGSSTGARTKLKRLKLLKSGTFKDWNDRHLNALKCLSSFLSQKSNTAIHTFSKLRSPRLMTRIKTAFSSPFYRQTYSGQATLIVASILKRF